VRNPGETAAGTLPGARLIPLPRLMDSLDQLSRDVPVVVHCAGGYRSMIAASCLRHAGFSDVSDLLGGYGAWTAAGRPVAVATVTD
jgi:hydroxyacylglutathione hydrolase